MFESGVSIFGSKVTVTVITGAVATAAAFRKDLNTLFGSHRSLHSQIKTEEERIVEIDKVLHELNGESCAAARQALETDRTVALGRLKRLTREFSRQREDPNFDLSFIQRMLLLFRPDGSRAEIIHWAAWVFLAVGLISFVSFVNHETAATNHAQSAGQQVQGQTAKVEQKPDTDNALEYIADLVLLSCLGFLVLRGWALSERRAVQGYNSNGGMTKTAFLLKRPVNMPMGAAQGCFWACVYWIVESAEDFIQDLLLQGSIQTRPALAKFLIPFVAAIFCKQWAASELKYAKTPLPRWRRTAALFLPGFGTLVLAMCFFALAGSFAFIKLDPNFFDEKFHRIAFILQSAIWGIACSQWFALASQPVVSIAGTTKSAKAESAAA